MRKITIALFITTMVAGFAGCPVHPSDVACKADGDCPDTQVCSKADLCVEKGKCQIDKDCGDNERCNDSQTCVSLDGTGGEGEGDTGKGCVSDSACDGAQRCNDAGKCVDPGTGSSSGSRTFTVNVDAPGTDDFDGIDFAYDTFSGCTQSDLCAVDLATQDAAHANVNSTSFPVTLQDGEDGFRFTVRFRKVGHPDRFSYELPDGSPYGNVTVTGGGHSVTPIVTVVQWSGGPSADAIVSDESSCRSQANDLGGELNCN